MNSYQSKASAMADITEIREKARRMGGRLRGTVVVFLLIMMMGTVACGPVPLAQYGVRRIYREAKGITFDAFEAKPLTAELRGYERLQVPTLDNQMEDQIPPDFVTNLNDEMLKSLAKIKGLKIERTGTMDSPAADTAPVDAPHGGAQTIAPRPKTLILRGAIVDFDAGKKEMRFMQVGVGREGVLTLHLWLVDASSGETLAKYVVDSEVERLQADNSVMTTTIAAKVGELVADLLKQGNSKRTLKSARKSATGQSAKK